MTDDRELDNVVRVLVVLGFMSLFAGAYLTWHVIALKDAVQDQGRRLDTQERVLEVHLEGDGS